MDPNLVEAVEDKEMVEDMEDFVMEEPVEDIGVGREIRVEKVAERNVQVETRSGRPSHSSLIRSCRSAQGTRLARSSNSETSLPRVSL